MVNINIQIQMCIAIENYHFLSQNSRNYYATTSRPLTIVRSCQIE